MLAATSSPRRCGQASSTLLTRGAEVEVRVDDEGFRGSSSWFEATVVDFAPATRGPPKCTVEFAHPRADDGGGALKGTFPPSHVRPRPPPPSESSSPPRFHLHDIVEASYCQGWWPGIVMSTPDSDSPGATVTVGFPIARKLIKFPPHLVRPRRDYVDGDWAPSQSAMVVRPERPVQVVYEVGDKVEVSSHHHLHGCSWIPAAVSRVVDVLSYVVVYSHSKATEYVHCQFMRKPPDNSNGDQRRKVGAKIKRTEGRQSMSGESPSSPVDVAASRGDEHNTDLESSATKKPRKNLMELDSILAESVEHCSSGMDTPLSDRKKNDHVCADHSAMETAIPSPDYRVQKAGVGEVGQQAGDKVDDNFVLSCLRNSRSSQFTIGNSPLGGCSASESLLSSPMALSNTSDQQALFVKSSPVWLQIEAMDVFCVHPQRPHFLPLMKYPSAMREGMAVGLMTVFSHIVGVIRKANIYNSKEWFEDKFSTLHHLKEHGFSVQSFDSTLTKLVKIKSQHTTFLGEIAKLDVKIEGEAASLTRINALLDEKDRALAELEQKLGCLRREIQILEKEKENKEIEIQNLAKEKENKEIELPRLKTEQSRFKEAYGDVEREFCSVLAALPRSSLT